MSKDRRKERKNEKRLKKDRERQQWKAERDKIASFRRRAPYMKMILRSRGCQLPFYDFLDSYEDEFAKLAGEYSATRPTLIGIREVDAKALQSTDWGHLGADADWQQVFYKCADDASQTYGRADRQDNVQGSTTTFRDATGGIHTLVLIRRDVQCAFRHKEWKYALKIPGLLHEIGHVIDVEERVNFDPVGETCRIIDAEVYANLYALEQCVQRGYRQSFVVWVDSWRQYVKSGDYRGEVARRTLDMAPSQADIVDWNTFLAADLTEGELRMIGESGREALSEG